MRGYAARMVGNGGGGTVTVKRGDLAIIHSVSRIAVNGGRDYDTHSYALHVVTSVTRDGAVKAVRELHRPDSTPQPVARMGRHTMVTVPAAVCDLAALAQHVATVRTRTADAGYTYIPNHDSPVELLRDLAPHVSDASAIDAVRAAAHRVVRESLDFVGADCARCGVRIGDGAGTVATDADGCPMAVCRECPHGVDFRTAYPVGLEVTVTHGYAQYLTTRIDSVIDYVIDGYYAGRSYGVTLPGYGARTLTEDCFAPVHVPADRYAVTRETSQPVEAETTADGGAAAPETTAQPVTSQPVADSGASSQPATVETSQPVAPADGGEVDMPALAATLAEMGFSLAPDGTVTDTAAPLAGAGLKDVCKQLAKRGGDSRGPVTHGQHAALLTALGDRQGAAMMRVAGALDCVGDKPLSDTQRATLRRAIPAGIRGAAIPAVGEAAPAVRGAGTVEAVTVATVPAIGATVEVDGRRGRVLRSGVRVPVKGGAELTRVRVFFPADGGASLPAPVEAQPVATVPAPAQPAAAPTVAPGGTVTCPAPACGRTVRVTRDSRYRTHRAAGSECVMSRKPIGAPAPAPRAAFSRPVAPAQPETSRELAQPETSRAAATVEAPAALTGPTVTVSGVEVPRAVSNDGNALEAPAPVPVPDRIGPGVWVVTGGGDVTPVARSGRYAGADGHWVETSGLPRFAPAHTVRTAVIGDTVCPRPRFACYCGLVHATRDILAALPIADGAAQPVETSPTVEAETTAQPVTLADIAAESGGRVIVATVGADGIRPVETSRDTAQPVEAGAGETSQPATVPAALAPVTRDEPHLYRADPRSRKDSRRRYRCQCGATYDARRIHLTPRELAAFRAQREREQTTAAPETAPGVLRLEHSTTGGTVLYGTRRGDGSAAVMGRAGLGWGFSRNIGADGAWYVSGSRGKSADWRTLDRVDKAARALAAAGFRVAVMVHGEPREVDGVPVELPAVEAPTVAPEVPAAQPVETAQPETSREVAQPATGGEVDAQPVPAVEAAPVEAPREVCEAVWHPRAGTVRVFRTERTSRVEVADYPADTRAAAVAALAAHGYTVSGVWMADPFGSLSVSVDRAPAPAAETAQPVGRPDETYRAAWSPAERTVTVIRDVRAGVCGPFGDYPADSREAAAAVLAANGYAVTGDWDVSRLGDHWAPLALVPQPVADFPMPAPYWAPGYGPADGGETSQPETTAQPVEAAPETSRELAPVEAPAPVAQPETSQPVEWLTPAQTAQLVRAALRDAFPAVTFSVRCSRGSALRVHWQDGPTERAVREVTDAYRGADYDAMQELNTYRDAVTLADGRRVRFGVHFIFTSRDETAQPVEAPAPAPVVQTSQPVAAVEAPREVPAPVADSRDYPHAAILRELAGRPLAGRVKVSRVSGVWCYRAQLRDGGEVTGRAVWSDESARWDVCAVYRAWSFVPAATAPAAPVEAQPVETSQPEAAPTVPDTLAPVVAGWAADRMPVPVSPAPARPVAPVVPARVAAALARVTSQPVAPRTAAPVVSQPAPAVAQPVAPVASVPVAAGERGRYCYAPGTRVRATLREVRKALADAQRAPETAPTLAGVTFGVEADRPTVARPTGYVVVTVEAPAGADLAAVWAAVDEIAARRVPGQEVAAV